MMATWVTSSYNLEKIYIWFLSETWGWISIILAFHPFEFHNKQHFSWKIRKKTKMKKRKKTREPHFYVHHHLSTLSPLFSLCFFYVLLENKTSYDKKLKKHNNTLFFLTVFIFLPQSLSCFMNKNHKHSLNSL